MSNKIFSSLDPPRDDPDKIPLRFGKHKGSTPEQVARVDPGWIAWAFKNIKPYPFSKTLGLACQDVEDERQEALEDEWDHDTMRGDY